MGKPIVNPGSGACSGGNAEVPVYAVIVIYNSGARETWTAFGKDAASEMVKKLNAQRYIRNIRSVYCKATGKTVRCPS